MLTQVNALQQRLPLVECLHGGYLLADIAFGAIRQTADCVHGADLMQPMLRPASPDLWLLYDSGGEVRLMVALPTPAAFVAAMCLVSCTC